MEDWLKSQISPLVKYLKQQNSSYSETHAKNGPRSIEKIETHIGGYIMKGLNAHKRSLYCVVWVGSI